MMAPGLYAAVAVLAVAPAASAQAPSSPTGAGAPDRKTDPNDLYAVSPSRGETGLSGKFFKAYGSRLGSLELERGAQLGSFALAGAGTSPADRRAGVGSGGGLLRLVLLAAVAMVLAAAAFLTLPGAARAALPAGFIGVTTEDAYTGSNDYAARELGRQRAAGFTLARQVFRWNEIEPKDGRYDFSATDRFVLNTARAGIRVMPLLQGEPEWATSRPKGNTNRALFPPKDNATYARFAAVIAGRYGPKGTFWAQNPSVVPVPITSYQLWNEPNFPIYWAGKPNAAAYARMVIAASKAIRKVQPKAYIVSAGIPDSSIGQSPKTFVKGMLRAKAGASLNAIGIHPYAINVTAVMGITKGLRRTINAAGGRKLDLWVTEIGWGAGGPATPKRTVSYAKQGPTIVSAFQRLAAARRSLKLRGVVYFAWRDSEVYQGGKDFWGLHTGLVDRAGNDKPSLAIVSSSLRALK